MITRTQFLQAEAEYLAEPDRQESINVRITGWISLCPTGDESPAETFGRSAREKIIDIRDLEEVDIEEVDGSWPGAGDPDPDREYDERRGV